MKKIQTPGSNALVISTGRFGFVWILVSVLCLSASFRAQSSPAPKQEHAALLSDSKSLAKGDSLYHAKQYIQSLHLYEHLFEQKKYSPAMLLKMAYIEEGSGHLSQSLYFMNLYYKVSHDPQALVKIEEIASRNKLEGYKPSEYAWLFAFAEENYFRLTAAIASVVLLLTAVQIYQKRRSKNTAVVAVAQIFFLAAFVVLNNFSSPYPQGIISRPATYLMSGPSAAAHVVGIVGEGHQLEIIGHNDVWLKVKWMDKEAYIKENAVLPVRL